MLWFAGKPGPFEFDDPQKAGARAAAKDITDDKTAAFLRPLDTTDEPISYDKDAVPGSL